MRIALAFHCFLAAMISAGPALATTDAYVLIETLPGKTSDVLNTNWGFGQCKGLFHSFQPHEIVVQIACDDLANLGKVIGEDIPGKDGVFRVTVWSVTKGE